MCLVIEIEHSDFSAEQFDFIIGKYATYNRYYKISINHLDKQINIGLQTTYNGIYPQVQLLYNYILLGAGEIFYVYDLKGNKVKDVLIGSAFYGFYIQNDHILIVGELDLYLLDQLFKNVWEIHFNEIIDIVNVNEKVVEIVDYNNNLYKIELLTGKVINKTER